MEYGFGERHQEVDGTGRAMNINGDVISKVESFKYLGSFIQRPGGYWRMYLKRRILGVVG